MAERYKRKKKLSASEEVRKSFRQFNWKLLATVAVVFTVVFVLYQIGIFYEWKPIIHIYAWAIFGLLITYVIINRGFGKPKDEKILREEAAVLSAEYREEYVINGLKRRKISKILTVFLISFVLTYMIDIVTLVFQQLLSGDML